MTEFRRDTSRTMSWTTRVEHMLKGDKKEKTRQPNAYIKKIGPWGGDGGIYRDTKLASLRLRSITIKSGLYIYSLKFSYSGEYKIRTPGGSMGRNSSQSLYCRSL
ncbi:hypothetical protein ACQ4PT_034314 [Festuca glaucescens]